MNDLLAEFDPCARFSRRAEHYLRGRPRYPRRLPGELGPRIGLTPDWTIADLGCGTGFLSEPFLANGNLVHGVEPNADMRAAAERHLARFERFRSHCGSAEDTGLAAGSIDLATIGQALHWFDLARAVPELSRILRPGGFVAVVRNQRRTEGSLAAALVEEMLGRWAGERRVAQRGRDTEAALRAELLDPVEFSLESGQRLDREGLEALLLSISITPAEDDPHAAAMLADLRRRFTELGIEREFDLPYDTRVLAGRMR